MTMPLSIAFQDLEPSEFVEQRIREEAEKLSQFEAHITKCHVVVAQPHRHSNKGNAWHVRIDVDVPHAPPIIVNREPGVDHAHDDVYVAIRDAFKAARRQLQDRHERG